MNFQKVLIPLVAFGLTGAAVAQQAPATKSPAQAPAAQATAPAAKTPAAAPATANPNRASDAEVQKLFEAMHLRENNEHFLQSIVPLLDQQARKTPGFATMDDKDKEYFTQVKQEESSKLVNPTFVDQLTQSSIPAYADHLSSEDVKQITAFYASSAGQHLQEKLPDISKQAMETAMPLVRQRAQEVVQDQQKKLGDYMTKKYGTTTPKTDPLAPKQPSQIETLPK
jgi:hypothetical protein